MTDELAAVKRLNIPLLTFIAASEFTQYILAGGSGFKTITCFLMYLIIFTNNTSSCKFEEFCFFAHSSAVIAPVCTQLHEVRGQWTL